MGGHEGPGAGAHEGPGTISAPPPHLGVGGVLGVKGFLGQAVVASATSSVGFFRQRCSVEHLLVSQNTVRVRKLQLLVGLVIWS